MTRHAIFAVMALVCLSSCTQEPAYADEPKRCGPIAASRAIIDAAKGSWIELTAEQRAFLEGIFAMNPQTPVGLPYGDKAVLAQRPGRDKGGVVFFIDGDFACDGFPVPEELIQMLVSVGKGDVLHEGRL